MSTPRRDCHHSADIANLQYSFDLDHFPKGAEYLGGKAN
jgi:hypothetical protein